MAGVFISYRRTDSGGWAGRLFDHLSLRFGKDLVFQDFDDIKPGENFLEVIRKGIKTCDVTLVLIGPNWLKNAEGRRRLDDPQDVLRMEISEALKGDRIIIPVLLGKAGMPAPEDLPDPVKALSTKNAVEIADSRWNYDVGQLMARLRELILPAKESLSLKQVQQELDRMQRRYFELLPHNAAEALELAQKTLAFLDHVCPLYPQDSYLQLVRGYLHKNEAMALRNFGRYEEVEKALNQAERVFDTMLLERPEDAGAWNGKGSVEALRGNLKEALGFIDRALQIDPNYEAARGDREEILKHL